MGNRTGLSNLIAVATVLIGSSGCIMVPLPGRPPRADRDLGALVGPDALIRKGSDRTTVVNGLGPPRTTDARGDRWYYYYVTGFGRMLYICPIGPEGGAIYQDYWPWSTRENFLLVQFDASQTVVATRVFNANDYERESERLELTGNPMTDPDRTPTDVHHMK